MTEQKPQEAVNWRRRGEAAERERKRALSLLYFTFSRTGIFYSDLLLSIFVVSDNSTELSKVITLLDDIPGYTEILLQTMLQPDRVRFQLCSGLQLNN